MFSNTNLSALTRSVHDACTGLTYKGGAGRAAIHSCFGVVHCYTLESHFYMDRGIHRTKEIATLNSPGRNPKKKTLGYTPTHWRGVGKAAAVALLDLHGDNPYSRLPDSFFHSLSGMRQYLRKIVTDRQSKVKQKRRKAEQRKELSHAAAAPALAETAKINAGPKTVGRKSSRKKKNPYANVTSVVASMCRPRASTSHDDRLYSPKSKKGHKKLDRPRSNRGRKSLTKIQTLKVSDDEHNSATSRAAKASGRRVATTLASSQLIAEAVPPPSPTRLSSPQRLKLAVQHSRAVTTTTPSPDDTRRLSSPQRLKRAVRESRALLYGEAAARARRGLVADVDSGGCLLVRSSVLYGMNNATTSRM